jgi:hypothetical protein
MTAPTEQSTSEKLDQAKIESILEFYEAVLKPELEPARCGEFVVLDPSSFDYEVDAIPRTARKRLQVRHPNTLPVTLEIGCPVITGAYTMTEVSRSRA